MADEDVDKTMSQIELEDGEIEDEEVEEKPCDKVILDSKDSNLKAVESDEESNNFQSHNTNISCSRKRHMSSESSNSELKRVKNNEPYEIENSKWDGYKSDNDNNQESLINKVADVELPKSPIVAEKWSYESDEEDVKTNNISQTDEKLNSQDSKNNWNQNEDRDNFNNRNNRWNNNRNDYSNRNGRNDSWNNRGGRSWERGNRNNRQGRFNQNRGFNKNNYGRDNSSDSFNDSKWNNGENERNDNWNNLDSRNSQWHKSSSFDVDKKNNSDNESKVEKWGGYENDQQPNKTLNTENEIPKSPIQTEKWSYESDEEDDKPKNETCNTIVHSNTSNFNLNRKETSKIESESSAIKAKVDSQFGKWGNSLTKEDGCGKWGESPVKINDNCGKWGESPVKANDTFGKWGGSPVKANNTFGKWGGSPVKTNDNFGKWGGSPVKANDNFGKWGGSPVKANDNFGKWGGSPDKENDNFGKWGGSPVKANDNCGKWGESPVKANDNFGKWGGSPVKANDNFGKWGGSPVKANDNFGKWSGSPDKENDNFGKWGGSPKKGNENFGKWGESSDNRNENFGKWGGNESNDDKSGKWGASEESNNNFGSWGSNNKEQNNFKRWGSTASDDEGNNNNRGFDNRRGSWRRNDDRNSGRGRGWSNRGGNREKRGICKYFSMGSCRHGDNCTYLHESPNNNSTQQIQEASIKELCRFYEHQQCYKKSSCKYMHEEFPCKLYHAGSKMCPSGDSCKYSHSPLTGETKDLLEKYLDEKVDERTDKSNCDSSSNLDADDNKDKLKEEFKSNMEMPDGMFPDPMRQRFPGDVIRMPYRYGYNPMVRFPDMQMDMMHRQRMMFPYPVPGPTGRIFPRGVRGMVIPNTNGMPYAMPHMMQGPHNMGMPHPMMHDENEPGTDPYIDNLAQLVAGRDIKRDLSPKRLGDVLDTNIQNEDDEFNNKMDDYTKNPPLTSPVKTKSPEIPPGTYVPNNNMNAIQPNVRLGHSMSEDNQMMFGGFSAHGGDQAMMDYINMSAIHYFQHPTDATNFEKPWKILLLDVPVKIPYPLMNIDTNDLPHKYIDPRLKGHPSILNPGSTETEASTTRMNSYEFAGTPSQHLQNSPSNMNQYSETRDIIRNDDSPSILPTENNCNFMNRSVSIEETNSSRAYLLDPRFKRKKVSSSGLESIELQ